MEHRKQGLKTLLLLMLGVAFTTGLYGQGLADLARKTPRTSGKVLTNDDVGTSAPAPAPAPAPPAATTPAAAGAAPGQRPAGQAPAGAPGQAAAGQPAAAGQAAAAGQPGQAAAGQGQAPAGQAAAGAAPAEKTPAELEQEYRMKFAELRENLSLEERKLDILQRELNLMQNQYYSDPAATLMQEQSRSNINTRIAEIEMQKGVVEMAKQAIAALEDELRVKGLPAGWAR